MTSSAPAQGSSISPTTKIVSWMGGEHWYIGNLQFMRLEEAISFCEKNSLTYEVITDPHYYPGKSGD